MRLDVEQHIEERMKSPTQKLLDIAEILRSVPPLELTSLEKEFIEQPFPIVWGSTSKEGEEGGCDSEERKLFGPQFLGEDIQVLLTQPQHMDEVRNYLNAFMPAGLHVEVLPISYINKK